MSTSSPSNTTAEPGVKKGNPDGIGGQESVIQIIIPVILVVVVIIAIGAVATRKKKDEYPGWWDEEFR